MNRLIEWSDDLATGVDAIDRRNRALIEYLNALHECVHRRRGVDACRAAVNSLRACTKDASRSSRALAGHLDAMLARMDDEQSNITFHGLHELKLLVLACVREPAGGEQGGQLAEPEEAVKVFGLTLRRA